MYKPSLELFSDLIGDMFEEVIDSSVKIVSGNVQEPKAHEAISSFGATVRHLREDLIEVTG